MMSTATVNAAAAVAHDVLVVQRILLASTCFQACDAVNIPARTLGKTKWHVRSGYYRFVIEGSRVSRRLRISCFEEAGELHVACSTRCCCDIAVHLHVSNVHGILITCTAFWVETCFLLLQRRPSTLLPSQRDHRRRPRTSRMMSTMLYDSSRKATTRRRATLRE